MIGRVSLLVPTDPEAGVDDVLAMVRALPPEKRRVLAETLALREDAPRALIRCLAQDEIVIAETVIVNSPVLTDEDLCALVALGSPAHVLAVGARPALSVAVAEALGGASRGEGKLVALLRAGKTQEFETALTLMTQDGAREALDRLLDGDAAPLAALCRAARFRRATYSAIVLLYARPNGRAEALLAAYE